MQLGVATCKTTVFLVKSSQSQHRNSWCCGVALDIEVEGSQVSSYTQRCSHRTSLTESLRNTCQIAQSAVLNKAGGTVDHHCVGTNGGDHTHGMEKP